MVNDEWSMSYFASNAQGSASEMETELIIAYRLGYLNEALFGQLMSALDRVGRLLTGLSKHLRSKK